MTRLSFCCEHCLESIARESTIAARMWAVLCEMQVNGYVLHIPNYNYISLALLERLGFITTTDHEKTLSVRVHGQKSDGECDFFCTGKCRTIHPLPTNKE